MIIVPEVIFFKQKKKPLNLLQAPFNDEYGPKSFTQLFYYLSLSLMSSKQMCITEFSIKGHCLSCWIIRTANDTN